MLFSKIDDNFSLVKISTYILYLVSYKAVKVEINRQLSADIKLKDSKIKTSFVSPELPKARANKTELDL